MVYAIVAIVSLIAWSSWTSVRKDRALRARLADQEILFEQRDVSATVTASLLPLSYRHYNTTFDLVVTRRDAALLRVPAFKAPPIDIRRAGAPSRWGELVVEATPEIAGDTVIFHSSPGRWSKLTVTMTVSDPAALRRALQTFASSSGASTLTGSSREPSTDSTR